MYEEKSEIWHILTSSECPWYWTSPGYCEDKNMQDMEWTRLHSEHGPRTHRPEGLIVEVVDSLGARLFHRPAPVPDAALTYPGLHASQHQQLQDRHQVDLQAKRHSYFILERERQRFFSLIFVAAAVVLM